MTEFRVHSRPPGARVATLDGPWGRLVWVRGRVCKPAGRLCSVCSGALLLGSEAWRATMTNNFHARRARICAPCLDRLAAA